jgi:putative ABC transport system permease protein
MTQSLRVLRKHWRLSAIAVFSLSVAMAIGILALSVSNTALLLPPAGVAPDRLVMIHARSNGNAVEGFSYPDYRDYRARNHVFTDIAIGPSSIGLRSDIEGDREIKLSVTFVSENYFDVMGLQPYLGRFFNSGEKNAAIAVMTYSFWRRLGSDPRIIGKVIGSQMIIGVAPKTFTGSLFGIEGDLFAPNGLVTNNPSSVPPSLQRRDARDFQFLARLKPGVSRKQAQIEMKAISDELATEYPKEDKGRVAVVTRATLLPPDAVSTAELLTGILMALVLLVLLIACANVANLLLAVAVGRRQEAVIKLALGAARGRLIREFLRESILICAVSGALAYGIAAAVIARYSNITVTFPMLGTFPLGLDFHLDATVLTSTLVLVLVAVLATGLAPALYASSPHLSQVLSGELVVGGTRKNARRNALVIIQVAVCTLVLIGMGLCQRSLYNLRHVDAGFSARNLVAIAFYSPAVGPPVIQGNPKSEHISEAQGKEFYGLLRRAAAAVPGVEAVSLSDNAPILSGNPIQVQLPGEDKRTDVGHNVVDADYFSTLGIPILDGRAFNSGDREKTPEVVVINHKMAETFWPGQDAIGKIVLTVDPSHPDTDSLRPATVIGIAKDGKYGSLDEPTAPYLYYALSQHYLEGFSLIARTKGAPNLWIQPLTQATHGITGFFALQPMTMDDWMNLSLIGQRIAAACVGGLSALGLLLAVVGLFGAISYSVSERKKELGIRVALGARPWQLLKMIFQQTLLIVSIGIAIGTALGVVATVLLRAQFYGVSAVEWTVLVPVIAAMVGVSLLVAYVSAKSWIKVDPLEAVRHA